ncbi:hypothetical protein AB0F07_19385 [Streptomyces fructofermentans]|uniref:hypothetical protein n=1 Tax=Streptomyces fructofermentans TaxID=152141 RepID=UPI0033D453CF
MGWVDTGPVGTEGRPRGGAGWSGADVNAAAAVGAAQLPVVTYVLLSVVSDSGDSYGIGYGGGLAALGYLCVMVFSPPVFAFLGLVQAVAHTLPAVGAGHFLARRFRGPEWLWRLLPVMGLGAFWAVPAAAVTGVPHPVWVLLLGCSAALAALGVVHVRRRAPTPGRALSAWGVWFRSPLVTLAAAVLAVPVTWAGYATGVLRMYEPPTLSEHRLTAEWRGGGGAVLRLGADGRARFENLPSQTGAESPGRDFVRCDGEGTWRLDRDGEYDSYLEEGPEERDGVLLEPAGPCGDDTFWTIGGTRGSPELFVLFGDPDAGDLRTLTRR